MTSDTLLSKTINFLGGALILVLAIADTAIIGQAYNNWIQIIMVLVGSMAVIYSISDSCGQTRFAQENS